jgi:threonine/homoserine/homoserine lactone efflux protein
MMSIIGLPIGLYGYLFPGNINIMMIDLYRNRKMKLLVISLIAMIVFETIYCIGTLQFLATIKSSSQLFRSIEIISLIMTLTMGLWMLLEKRKDANKINKSNIARGFISIIFHPQQIPFWVIIAVVVNPLMNNYNSYGLAFFAISNAIGALLAMIIYMTIGTRLVNFFSINSNSINKSIALVYIGMSVFIGIKLIF